MTIAKTMFTRIISLIVRIFSGEPLEKATANQWRWFGRTGIAAGIAMVTVSRASHFVDKATAVQLLVATVAFLSVITIVPMLVAPKIAARVMAYLGFIGFIIAFAQVAIRHLKL